jgi:hypothetical protein
VPGLRQVQQGTGHMPTAHRDRPLGAGRPEREQQARAQRPGHPGQFPAALRGRSARNVAEAPPRLKPDGIDLFLVGVLLGVVLIGAARDRRTVHLVVTHPTAARPAAD